MLDDSIATAAQDTEAHVIWPVVHHALENVEITTRRNGFEKASGSDLAAIDYTCPREIVGMIHHLRLIVEDATGTGMGFKHFREEAAAPSPDIDNSLVAKKQQSLDSLYRRHSPYHGRSVAAPQGVRLSTRKPEPLTWLNAGLPVLTFCRRAP